MVAESTRTALIESALALVDESGGIRGVTLRAVANRAGCAHTNAYNYFPSLDKLFWEALAEAMKRNVELRDNLLTATVIGSQESFSALVAAQVQFAMAHPGWYRLIWLEPMNSAPPQELLARMVSSWTVAADVVRPLLGESIGEEELKRAIDIIHSYIHGEICNMISGRDAAIDSPRTKERVLANARFLLRLLADDNKGKNGRAI